MEEHALRRCLKTLAPSTAVDTLIKADERRVEELRRGAIEFLISNLDKIQEEAPDTLSKLLVNQSLTREVMPQQLAFLPQLTSTVEFRACVGNLMGGTGSDGCVAIRCAPSPFSFRFF